MIHFFMYLIIGVILAQLSFIEHKKTTNEKLWYKNYWKILLLFSFNWILIAPALYLTIRREIFRDLLYWGIGLLIFSLTFFYK